MNEVIKDFNCSTLEEFFRLAYISAFHGKVPSNYFIKVDCDKWRTNRMIPPYVRQYLEKYGL